jgi:hypothetical protein
MNATDYNLNTLFEFKLKEINSSPLKLRRMINKWPYYETLNKIILKELNRVNDERVNDERVNDERVNDERVKEIENLKLKYAYLN